MNRLPHPVPTMNQSIPKTALTRESIADAVFIASLFLSREYVIDLEKNLRGTRKAQS